jgi:hypothetical protein
VTNDALSLDTTRIVSPDHYQHNGYPHAEWALWRPEAPVYWYDRGVGDPFWAEHMPIRYRLRSA